MSEEEIADLASLDRSRFEAREHLALSWIRAGITSRDGAPAQLDADFRAEFDARERGCIVATMQGMFISNLTTNTLFGWILQRGLREEQPTSCAIV